ncbi:MAG: hypothetical protein IID18_08360 [Nitrospinae bacterium]|nr:hypothetical protein [Nitrospinota bacterium]
METLNAVIVMFAENTFAIPLWPMLMIFGMCLWSLLYGRYKTGLIVAYFFIFYWGFLSDRMYWIGMFGENPAGQVIYICSAMAIAFMGLLGLYQEGHR